MRPFSTPVERSFLRFRERGDASALAAVFDATAPALHRIAMHLVPDAAEAEDLVQATFVTAIERAERFDGERPLLPWLVGVLGHHARNARRRARRAVASEVVEVEDSRRSEVDRAVDRETAEAIRRAVERLPEPYREVLRQHLGEGLGGAEIAARLERAPGTVRLQIHRGLKRLRALLSKGTIAGAALGATSTRGLAAVREAVMDHAALHAPAATAVAAAGGGSLASIGLGGSIMSKKLAAAAVLLGATASVATFWPEAPPEEVEVAREEVVRPPAPPAPATAPAASDVAGEDRRLEGGAGARVAEARAAVERAAEAFGGVKRKGVVRGRVIDADSGFAVVGAKVVAGLDARTATATEPALTAADGTFEFEPLRPVVLSAWVEADGYAVATAPLRARTEDGRTVHDAGEVRLFRGTRVTGRVLDAAGAPVAGAVLMLHEPPIVFSSFLPSTAREVGASGEGGWFDLPAVPPTGEGGTRLFSFSPAGAGRADLDLVAGRDRLDGVEIRLSPTARLDVRVVDGSGDPVAGAAVEAIPWSETFFLPSFLQAIDRGGEWGATSLRIGAPASAVRELFVAVTDERGRATLATVPVGPDDEVVVAARKSGFVDAASDRIGGAAGGRESVIVTLLPATGRRVAGVVVTAGGRPMPNVGVRASASAYVRWSEVGAGTTTDADGRFELDALSPSRPVWLSVAADGVARLPHRVDVPADRDLEGVELVARPARPVTVTVVDQYGRPVEGATGTLRRDATFLGPEPRSSRADGVLRFPDAVDGPWRLSVTLPAPKEDWRVARLSAEVVGGEARRLEATREEPGIAELIVEVVDGATGLPVEPTEARVWMDEVVDGVVRHRWRPDETERRVGEVRARHLKPGDWQVHVAAGVGAAKTTVTVRPGDSVTRARIEIAAPGTVAGRVLAGFPIPAVLTLRANRPVVALDAGGRPLAEAESPVVPVARDGSFRLRAPAGPLHLTVAALGWRGAQAAVVRSGEEVECEVRLHRGAVIEVDGEERYADGRLAVMLTPENGGAVPWLVRHESIPAAGSTRQTVAPGRYTYEVLYGVPKPGQHAAAMPRIASGTVVAEAGERVVLRLP